MHMHNTFMKMHNKHRGPPLTRMFHGRPGLDHHSMPKSHEVFPQRPHKLGYKLHKIGQHNAHPRMAHRMQHGIHGKHHHMKHHRRSSSCSSSSSSCSSEKEDEFMSHEQCCKENPDNSCATVDHIHKKPSPELFLMKHKGHGRPHHKLHKMHKFLNHMQKPGDVLPYTKFTHHGPFHMMHSKHKMGPHKMHPHKHKMLEMRHHMAHHKLGQTGHHMMRRLKHRIHHHGMFKKHQHLKHIGRYM